MVDLSNLSWEEAEDLVGELFKKKGYKVEVTERRGDYGIDVWAQKDGMILGIQVKHWNGDVGFEDVSKTLGSNLGKANKYIVISTKSYFTFQAWEHQRQHSHLIELWDTVHFREELDTYDVELNSASPRSKTSSFEPKKKEKNNLGSGIIIFILTVAFSIGVLDISWIASVIVFIIGIIILVVYFLSKPLEETVFIEDENDKVYNFKLRSIPKSTVSNHHDLFESVDGTKIEMDTDALTENDKKVIDSTIVPVMSVLYPICCINQPVAFSELGPKMMMELFAKLMEISGMSK